MIHKTTLLLVLLLSVPVLGEDPPPAEPASAPSGPVSGGILYEDCPGGPPSAKLLDRKVVRVHRFGPAELDRLRRVDGERVRLPNGEKTGRELLLELPAWPRTRLTWTWRGPDLPAIAVWDGKAWRFRPGPEFVSRATGTGLLRELRLVVELPAGSDRLWIRVGRNTDTDAVTTCPAGPDDRTAERILEHGPEANGLTLSAWWEYGTLFLVADNRRNVPLRLPFRKGRLLLSARCGETVEEAEVEPPAAVRRTDIPTAAGATCSLPVFRFRLVDLPLTPQAAGFHEIRFRFVRKGPDRGPDSGHWAGTAESNPVRMKLTGWVPAAEAARLAREEEKVSLPAGEGGWPRTGDYRSGGWSYRFLAGGFGTRSEAVNGFLEIDGRPVIPGQEEDRIRTPFGTLTWHGRLPSRNGLLGWLGLDRDYGQFGWLPSRR